MRKFISLLFTALTAIAAQATDYSVPIRVTVNGISTEQTGTITIEESGGLYDLNLRNFVLQSGDMPLPVGNVELKGIKPRKDGDATLLIDSRVIKITDGDDPGVGYWMAAVLPEVPVELRAKIEDGRLRCFIDIDLMEVMQQVIQVAIGDGYQLPNPGFEAWHPSADTYEEPDGWHSFESATGALASLAGHHIGKSADAHSGQASARIFATSIFGIVANGTMTTGRMNAGAMTADDTANHAYLDMSMTDTDGNGDPFYTPLYSRPDSVALWVKFKQGNPSDTHPYATLSAVITDGTRYQDPEDKPYTNVVAKATDNKIATTDGKWVRIAAPFVYTDNNVSPKAVLITVSTNADAGQGSAGDEMIVDDIELIYNAMLTSIKIKGREVPDFSPEKTLYEMELNEEITADDIEAAADGMATNIVKQTDVEGEYYLCTIEAYRADMSAMSKYIVKVKSNATSIRDLPTATGQKATYFTLDGRQATALKPGGIYLCRKADGTIVKIRK